VFVDALETISFHCNKKNEIIVLYVHQEYTINSSNMSFSNTALGQQQKCCLQPFCDNLAG
jgi:hypothetical protein